MKIHDQTFYVLGQTDFHQMVKERLAVLETALASTLLECAEIDALLPMYDADDGTNKQVTAKARELNMQATELRVRIGAVRSLTDEFDEPKGE